MVKVVRKKSKEVREVEQFLPDGVINAIAQVDSSFDSQKLLDAIIYHFGGFDKFAFCIVQEFKNAGPGTLVRQRILEMLTRLTMNISANNPPLKNVEDMDIDELRAAATSAVKEIDRKERTRVQQEAAQAGSQEPAAPKRQSRPEPPERLPAKETAAGPAKASRGRGSPRKPR